MTSRPKAKFYVYTLSHQNGRVFYVGKGCGDRVASHERDARKGCKCFKCSVIRKIWEVGEEVSRAIVFETDREDDAYEYEEWLVRKIGLDQLTNIAPGGRHIQEAVRRTKLYAPRRPVQTLNAREYRLYLRTRMKNKAADKIMEQWHQAKLNGLIAERRFATRQRDFKRRDEIDRRITAAWLMVGWEPRQEELGL